MISHTTERFRKMFADLPESIQRQARKAYKQFQKDPYHSSLYFKSVHTTKPIYSARITIDYRAVGIQNEMVLFWIGAHKEYDKLLYRL
ncbi:MAG TPA: hypothetical protein EYP59_19525 [Thiotrichaceae bacterium]|nr:hypothetical protein [Thiotrichaceae bacterium]